MAVSDRLFARWYPTVVGWSENAGQRETRAQLLRHAAGRTLEIGAGNGYDLPHYPPEVTELVVTEPSPHMHRHLRATLSAQRPPVGSWTLLAASAEDLPFAADTFDTVVAVYVHCTIPDPARALREIARVLRPGGRYLFLEHVRAPESRMLATVQDLLALPHAWIAAGCHPNRRTAQLLDESPLRVTELVHGHQPRSSPTVRPTIRGIAVAG